MPALSYTALDIITQAMIEIGMIAPGEVPDGDSAQWALTEFNNLIDVWQALEAYVYSYAFTIYTLTAGLSPHTIGPLALAPSFSTGLEPRPVRIESSALLLNTSGTLVDLPMNLRDHDWWAAQQTKEIQTNVPTDLFYDPTNPLGSLYFWPVPNATQQVRLQFWQTVSSFQQVNDPIGGPGGPGTLPQAYRAALTYTLAEMLCPGANKELSSTTAAKAVTARAAVFGNNAKSPRIQTQDWGMPKAGQRAGTRGDFNWFTGGAPGGPPE